MKKIYENPEFVILETTMQDVITASGEAPKKVTNGGGQSSEEGGVAWGNMW